MSRARNDLTKDPFSEEAVIFGSPKGVSTVLGSLLVNAR